jgi:hypothetical protein
MGLNTALGVEQEVATETGFSENYSITISVCGMRN